MAGADVTVALREEPLKNTVEPWRGGSQDGGSGRAEARLWAGVLQRGAAGRCRSATENTEVVSLVKRVRELLEGRDFAARAVGELDAPGGVRRSMAPPLSPEACRDVRRLAARLARLQKVVPGLAEHVGLAGQLERWVAELDSWDDVASGDAGGRSLSKWCGA